MNRTFSTIGAMFLLFATTDCSSTLAQPFQNLKNQPIMVYRLQNYEPPQQAAATPGLPVQVPPQIQQWLTAGAQLLPPGLVPPGLLPGTAAPAGDAPRFHGFRILQTMAVTDAKQRDEILELFGKDSNFQTPRQQCMYAEFGVQIGQGPPPGTPVGTPSSTPPADILVSLSCDQVQMFNYGWPHGAKNGLGPDTSKKFIGIAQKAFGN